MNQKISLIWLVCLSVVVGCGGSVSVEPAQRTEVDSAIGQLRWQSDVDGARATCTGTLVAPDLVLSARHCLYESDGRYRADTGKWLFSAGATEAAIDEIWTPPILWSHRTDDWDPPFGTPDLSLLHLAQPITAVEPLTVTLTSVTMDSPRFVTVGYRTGTRATSTTTLRALAGQPVHDQYASLSAFRTALGVPESSVDAERVQRWYDLSLEPGYEAHAGPAAGDSSPCTADSGSPLVRAGADGKRRVYGVGQRGLGIASAERRCELGAVYALFDNQESRDFLSSFGVVTLPPPVTDPARDQCTQCNGDWGRHGLAQIEGCNCRTTDAGKACNASEQCQGVCLLDAARQIEVEPGPPARGYFEGQCAEFVTSYGCHAVAAPTLELFEIGEQPPTLCFD